MWILIKLAPKGGGAGGVAVLVLIALLFSPFYYLVTYINFCQHKEQVIIEQTVCEGLTWSNDNSYVQGAEYLNLSINVSFKKKEVAYFTAHTLVFENDKYIGYIESEFSGTSERPNNDNSSIVYFETKTTQKLYFHIYHPTGVSWESDELFEKIYYGNLEDFKFVTNVIYTKFTDGISVGHFMLFPKDFYYDENGTIHYMDRNSDKLRYYYYDDNGKKHYVKT